VRDVECGIARSRARAERVGAVVRVDARR